MQLKTIKKIIALKLQLYKTQLLKKLPLPKFYKQKTIKQNKLNILFKRSATQQQLIKDLFGPNAYGVVYSTGNGKIINPVYDVQISMALGNSDGYNLEEINVLLAFLSPASVVYIAGTHVGTLLIPIAKKVNTVVGIEANPDSYRLLEDNILLNNLKNVQVFNCALYNAETTLSFHQGKANSGGSKIKPQNDIYSSRADTTEITDIQARRLDTICTENNLPAADMLIMDIEGSEYAALQGCPHLLQHCNTLYVEFQPHHLRNVSVVSAQDFFSLISPHFQTMQVMQEIVSGTTKIYSMPQALEKMLDLYNNDLSVDLLFGK